MERETLANAVEPQGVNGKESKPVHLTTTTTTSAVSERKREAARNNGRKSKGPRTARGKSISRLNAIKHGVFVKMAFDELQHVRGFESMFQLLDELKKAYPPQTPAADIQLEKLAIDLWREARATRMEICTTEKPDVFSNNWMPTLTGYANSVHKLALSSFARLEKLDEQARELRDSEAAEEEEEDASAEEEDPPAEEDAAPLLPDVNTKRPSQPSVPASRERESLA